MKKLLMPIGWPCRLGDAPPGPFVTLTDPDLICMKSEYVFNESKPNELTSFNSAGEFFYTGVDCMVQPVEIEVREDED